MRIRRALLSDLPTIRRISERYRFERNRDWKESISSKNREMFLLVENERILGFTGLIYWDWNNTLQILDIFVIPKYREHGLGLKLVNFLIRKAKKTKYRCLIAEAPALSRAVGLYKKAGFRKCGYNDRYYANGGKNIALWMSYDLK